MIQSFVPGAVHHQVSGDHSCQSQREENPWINELTFLGTRKDSHKKRRDKDGGQEKLSRQKRGQEKKERRKGRKKQYMRIYVYILYIFYLLLYLFIFNC